MMCTVCAVEGPFVLDNWSLLTTTLFGTLSSYALFTVLHDSVHGAVSEDFRWLNELAGRFALPFVTPLGFGAYPIFRYCHLEHHKNTNDSENDPDKAAHPDGVDSYFSLIPRWLILDINYLMFGFKRRHEIPKLVMEGLLGIAFTVILMIYIPWNFQSGFKFLFWHWILPSRLAILILAYSFDYLPHAGLKATFKEDRWKTTQFLEFPVQMVFTWLMFFQDYHVVHHLWPTVPFYRYAQVWSKKKPEIQQKGVPPKKMLWL